MLEERAQQHEERRRFEKLQGEVLGVTVSQARAAARTALRGSADVRDLQRREERLNAPAVPPPVRIQFSETVIQPQTVQYFPESTQEGQAFPSRGGVTPALPGAEGKYDLSIDSFGTAAWTFDTVPNAPLMVDGRYNLLVAGGAATWDIDAVPQPPSSTPTAEYVLNVTGDIPTWSERKLPPDIPDAIGGEDAIYALRRNSSADPAWVKLSKVELPDCSSDSLVLYQALALPPPGP